jgi:hypothetical protein
MLGGVPVATRKAPLLDGKVLEHVSTATNLQSTVTAKNAIILLLKEVNSKEFDQKLPQGENWPSEDRIQQKTEDEVESQK